MRRFAFLLFFTTGNFLCDVRGDCGGTAVVLGERRGSLHISFPAFLQSNQLIHNGTVDNSTEELSNVTCTWIINAQENQTVWIDVVHLDEDTDLRIKFSNETIVKGPEKGVFAGIGRTAVEWSWRNDTKTQRTFHLRWDTSEESHYPAQVPYTHSDNDPVSPSPDAPNRVTRAPDILGFGSGSPSVHTLRGVSVQQGIGVSVSDDKHGPPIPQEGTHNGQEKAGAAISDLVHTVTHSLSGTHTQSSLSYTHAETHMVTQTAPPLPLSSAEAKLPQLFAHTLAGHEDVSMATSTLLNRETDNAFTVAQTQSLTKKPPPNDSHKQTGTEIHSELHNGTEGMLLDSAASEASSHTASLTVDSVTYSEPIETHPKVQDLYNATISDISTTTSIENSISMVTVNRSNVTTLANTPPEDTLLDSAVPVASSLFAGLTVDSFIDNGPTKTSSQVQDLHSVTNSDISMMSSIDEGVSLVTVSQPNVTTLANTSPKRTQGTEMDQTSRSLRSAHPNQNISDQTQTSDSSTPLSDIQKQTEMSSQSEASESPFLRKFSTSRKQTSLAENHTLETHLLNTPTPGVPSLDLTTIRIGHTTIAQGRSTFQSGTNNQSKPTTDPLTAFPATAIPTTIPSDLRRSPVTSVEQLTEGSRTSNPALMSPLPNTVKQAGEGETNSTTFESGSMSTSVIITTHEVYPTVTHDFTLESTITTEEPPHKTSEQEQDTESPPGTQVFKRKQQTLSHTFSPHISTTAHSTGVTIAIPQSTGFPRTEHSSNDISHAYSSQSGISLGPMIPVSISPSISTETRSTEPGHRVTDRPTPTERNDPVTPTNHTTVISTEEEDVRSSTPSHWHTSKTPVDSLLPTSQWTRTIPTPSPTSQHFTTSGQTVLQTNFPTEQPSSSSPTNINSYQPGSNSASTPAHNSTSWLHPFTLKTDKDWSHKARVFIVEDQAATIKVETFQVLLQVVLEGNPPSYVGLVEVEPFLHRVAGYQSQQVTWHSGPVLQTVVSFRTVEALSWLGRVESLLHEAGLSPLPREGMLVGGARVKNITVGGLHTDVCSWLFTCPSGFQCVSTEGNASCRSLCHSEYCKHEGICVHRSGQQPLCQCPVGEDFWFMGQRCDLRMTRQRLVGVCFGVLLAVALLMAVLSYLAVRRFKTMLVQAKVDQTRSSYRRFNHFDELSARFWGRSWPGSEDSLDNPAFTRSDELLHMRAMDRTCCYHDDTLSITSTYQGSVSHLNTVYPQSSQYRWDLSNYSLADGVLDSGKASDLSVCSWPIEPIQWTPFPILQQLSRNTASLKASRPRSYCEGMELVDLEKSWTA